MKNIIFILAVILLPFAADAHLITENSGFMAGLKHPVLGTDHFIAMLCVGIISTQIGRRAIWTVPATFLIMMAIGGIIGFSKIHLPATEYVLAFSVCALGFAIASSRRMPVIFAMIFVGIFGAFHGYAHGIEMPASAKAFSYALGFVTATAVIHIAGVLIGIISGWFRKGPILLRFAGAVFAGMGLEMILVMKDLH